MSELHLRWIGVLIVSGVAAVHDARSGHIPNWIVALGLGLGAGGSIAAEAFSDAGRALLHAGGTLIGFVACGAVPLLLFRLRSLGGGDVKLLATMGALLGPTLGLELSFVAFGVAASWWLLRWLAARGAAHSRLALAFAPCLFVAALVLGVGHWRA
ncbi:MAG TPA: prepilin peptidase [Polyangiaceae bacterium]|nr:prepilin peptidase [Polyangiaceae bacterium]